MVCSFTAKLPLHVTYSADLNSAYCQADCLTNYRYPNDEL